MTRKLAVGVMWQFDMKKETAIELAKIADEAGIHSFWVPEGWSHDAFSLLISIAEKTKQIQLGTGIVNVYSRTPGALTQHFATLDEWSDGRAIIGLGASSANVIEQFHGLPFQPAFARIKETVEIINLLLRGDKLVYDGKWFQMNKGFTLRMQPVRNHIPIYIASLNAKSTKQTAEIADGWLPVWIPISALKSEIDQFRAWANEAGRDGSKLEVKAPGTVIVTDNPEAARDSTRPNTAYYIARMGDFYYRHISRLGFADEAAHVRKVFNEQGSAAGAAALSTEFLDEMTVAGTPDVCRVRLQEQEAAGATIHSVSIDTKDPVAFGRAVEALLR